MSTRTSSGAPPVRPRLSLKWKAFGLLLVLLAVVQLALGVRSYRALVAQSERTLQARMTAYPEALDELLADEAHHRAQIVSVLAATASLKELVRAESADPFLGAQLLADDLSADFFDRGGRPLGSWRPNPAEPAVPAALAAAAIAELVRDGRPVSRLLCAGECRQLVFVPTFDRDGRELVVALSSSLNDALLSLRRLGDVDIALLAPPGAAAPPVALGRLAGRELLAVTDAPTLLPKLQRLAAQIPAGAPAGELLHAGDRDIDLLLLRVPLAGGTGAADAPEVVFIADHTVAVRQIAAEFRRSAFMVLGGLGLSGLLVYGVLTPMTRRLTQLSRALPLLGERRYDEVRRAVGAVSTPPLADEIDVLRQTAQQLTDRLQALDAAEAASEAKSRFLAAMSHEIRTPMNGVMGMLELLEQSPLAPPQQQQLKVARDSARALLRVIDDILDFSKIEAGRMDLERVPFDLAEVIEGTLATLAPGLRERPVRLLSDIDPALPAQLCGDPLRLRQVLLNLASNAIKFTERGSVLVRARRAAAGAGEVAVHFEVIDSGIGIAPEAQRRLFQPFFQAESSISRRYGGSGLGLSICRGLVERMGGQLRVESEPGRGSCFRFRITFASVGTAQPERSPRPLAGLHIDCAVADAGEAALIGRYVRAAGADCGPGEGSTAQQVLLRVTEDDSSAAGLRIEGPEGERRLRRPYGRERLIASCAEVAGLAVATPVPAAAPAAPVAATAAGVARVLVAEDHPVNRQVIRGQLERLGYAADVVEDGEEALRRLQSGTYAALITDIQMPGLDGYQLAERQRVREARGEARGRLPILALSARALEGETQRCLTAGMDDYLSKPVLLQDLDTRLRRWIPDAPAPVATAVAAGSGSVTASPERAPVDLALLRECIGDDSAAISALLQEFLRINTPLLAQLRERVLGRAAGEAEALAHRLLGSARTAGALPLAEALARIESAARGTASREALSELWAPVAREFARLREWTGRLSAAAAEPALG